MANPSPQHTPTDGLGTATQITLTGSGLTTIVAGRQYKCALSLTGTSTIALTATVKDVGGTSFSSGNSNVVTWYTKDASVASVSAGTVTAVKAGNTTIEARFPTFDTTDGHDLIFVQVNVQVNP